jgi:hypothetical protein
LWAAILSKAPKTRMYISNSKKRATTSELTVLCEKAAKGKEKTENILDLS